MNISFIIDVDVCLRLTLICELESSFIYSFPRLLHIYCVPGMMVVISVFK